MDSTQRLEVNAKKAGQMVNWRSTKIGSTEGGRQSDPWRELGIASESYGRGMGRSPSYGRDALLDCIEEVVADQLDATARGYLVGLRYYLGNLPLGAKPRATVVEPLIRGFMANRNRS